LDPSDDESKEKGVSTIERTWIQGRKKDLTESNFQDQLKKYGRDNTGEENCMKEV